jgi:excisionase family DNA binding protein
MDHHERIAALEGRVSELERLISGSTRAVEPDRLYQVQDVAGYLGCGKTNVYDLIATRKLGVIRVGKGSKGYRVRGSDLLAFMDASRQGGPKPRMSLKNINLN